MKNLGQKVENFPGFLLGRGLWKRKRNGVGGASKKGKAR